MTIQDKVMQQRQNSGLMILARDKEGNECNLYPKDVASKQQWIQSLKDKGYTIIKGKE